MPKPSPHAPHGLSRFANEKAFVSAHDYISNSSVTPAEHNSNSQALIPVGSVVSTDHADGFRPLFICVVFVHVNVLR